MKVAIELVLDAEAEAALAVMFGRPLQPADVLRIAHMALGNECGSDAHIESRLLRAPAARSDVSRG